MCNTGKGALRKVPYVGCLLSFDLREERVRDILFFIFFNGLAIVKIHFAWLIINTVKIHGSVSIVTVTPVTPTSQASRARRGVAVVEAGREGVAAEAAAHQHLHQGPGAERRVDISAEH